MAEEGSLPPRPGSKDVVPSADGSALPEPEWEVQPRSPADHRAQPGTASTHPEESHPVVPSLASEKKLHGKPEKKWALPTTAAPPTGHKHTSTNRQWPQTPPISPKAAPSARTATPPAPPRPNQRSRLSPGEVGEGRGEGRTTMAPPRR
nr:proline-rich receptor-like protein kinase PERK13 [Lolium perenne]